MALLSNGLYRDDRYKSDCAKKINYLDIIDNVTANILKPTDKKVEETEETSLNIVESSEKQLYHLKSNEYTHIAKISNNYHKIIK